MRSKTASRARCSGRTGKLAVEIVRGLAQVVGLEPLADVDDLLNDVSAAGDDDHENARIAERHELDAVEDGDSVRRPAGKPNGARGLRQHMRDMRQDRIEQAVGAVASQSRFDRGRGIPRPLGFEQQIHVEAIAAIRGNATGRGMRAAGRSPLPRGAPGCSVRSPTTHPAQPRSRVTTRRRARPTRCTRARGPPTRGLHES
jgi:hypothetical protein